MRILHLIIGFFFCSNVLAQSENFEWQSRPLRDNLYMTRSTEIEQNLDFEELNLKIVQSLNAYAPELSEGRVTGVTYEQGMLVLKNLLNHPMYISEKQDYDTERNLGLCFGRATYLHLELLRYGVNKDSIKKIFVVGPMSAGTDKVWQFHVATLVKDATTNQWWALDTNIGKPILVNRWMDAYKRMATDKKYRIFRRPLVDRTKSLRFYVSEPQKIGPSSWEYNIQLGGLFHESYNMYFQDMFRYFKKTPVTAEQKFNHNQCRKLF
jgi:hypothetical protein